MDRKETIQVEIIINAKLIKVWDFWTAPKHIIKWNNASEDWRTTEAVNDLNVGGNFCYTMEAKDGSMGFDFGGVYSKINKHKHIEYVTDDGRKVVIEFYEENEKTKISETFEAERINPVEMQQSGWQSILDNFKRYVESN